MKIVPVSVVGKSDSLTTLSLARAHLIGVPCGHGRDQRVGEEEEEEGEGRKEGEGDDHQVSTLLKKGHKFRNIAAASVQINWDDDDATKNGHCSFL